MQHKGFFKVNQFFRKFNVSMKSYIFTLITKLFASSKTIKGRLDQINTKQNTKFILSFVFSQFYSKLPNSLEKKLFD